MPWVPEWLLRAWGWYGESDSQYARSGEGLRASNGWMLTQSRFNILELVLQIVFLCQPKVSSARNVLLCMFVSILTMYKTILYMSIIIHSAEPLNIVPGLSCLGVTASTQEAQQRAASILAEEGCGTQFFKFQFNFWWIICPAACVHVCWHWIEDRIHS